MNRKDQHTELESGDAQWVQKNIRDLEGLPSPQSEWNLRDVPFGRSILTKLRHRDMVERLDREKGETLYSYRTTPEAFEAVQTFLEQAEASDGLLPCGHSGFVNRGGVLDCKHCDGTFEKSEVKA